MDLASPTPNKDRLAKTDFDQVIRWIEEGMSRRAIAKQLGVETMALQHWLHATPLQSARVHAAMEAAAEEFEGKATAILDEAYQLVRNADQANASALVAAARERAQTCWRQASVRDPRRYSDSRKVDVTHTHTIKQADQLSTAELEHIARQAERTLELEADGSVTQGGGVGDGGQGG